MSHVDTVYYFGYGSLVNRETRPVDEPAWNARLPGWRRVWNHRVAPQDDSFGCTSLSIAPKHAAGAEPDVGRRDGSADTEHGIDGVLVSLPASDLPKLDEREHGYERLQLPRTALVLSGDGPSEIEQIYVYRSLGPVDADAKHPILRSYVDCVLAGYLTRFGWSGVTDFLTTTDGWHSGILDDRSAPRYPRAVSLTPDLRRKFDQRVASLCAA